VSVWERIMEGEEVVMHERKASMERRLGIGGLCTAVVGFVLRVTATANRVDALEVIAGLFGVAIIGLLVAISVRHRRHHPGGPGHTLIVTAWVLVALAVAWIIFVMIDPGLQVESWRDRLPSWSDLASMSGIMLAIPLVLASLGILRDGSEPQRRPGPGSVSAA
jgi:hypothetical protein